MANQIRFNIGFNVDKSGLTDLKTSLTQLQQMKIGDLMGNGTSLSKAKTQLQEIKGAAELVEQALVSSFNPKLNTYNMDQFLAKIRSSGTSLNEIQQKFQMAGAKGQAAFRRVADQLTATQLPLRQTSNLLKSMGTTLTNTIKWSIASAAVNAVTSSVQKAWEFTKNLDSALTDIMIVTDKSAASMAEFAKQANTAAKNLGTTTQAYTEAALIYYQQGLDDEQVAARANVTIKAANVTGQNADAVSEQLTAVWNGYKVSAAESELYIDKLAAVAASTAADLEELSTGMSRVASAANIMGVDVDQLNAQLATIVSVTREAPETIGTALKTVYARMSDLEAGTDTETTLGEYTREMAKFGIQALDSNGKLRDMGEVVEEIGNKWNTMSRNQQVALAQTIAGTRQYARMMSLFDNWDMYNKALETSQNSMGTLQSQQDIFMDSLEGHLAQLSASVEELYLTLLDTDSFKTAIDWLGKLVKGFDSFIEGIGGGGALLGAMIPLLMKMLSPTIGAGITRIATNFRGFVSEAGILKNTLTNINAIKATGIESHDKAIMQLRANLVKLKSSGVLSIEAYNDAMEQTVRLSEQVTAAEKEREILMQDNLAQSTALQRTFNHTSGADMKGLYNKAAQVGEQVAAGVIGDPSGQAFYQSATMEFNNIRKGIQNAQQAAINFQKTLKGLDDSTTPDLELLKAQFKQVSAAADQLKEGYGKKGVITRYQNALKNAFAEPKPNIEHIKSIMTNLNAEMQHAGEVALDSTNKMEAGFKKVANGGIAKSQQGIEALKNSLSQTLKSANFEHWATQITSFASSAAMAASAVTMLFNLRDIWNDDSLSGWEKAAQLITTLGFSLSMMSPLLMAAGKGLNYLFHKKNADTVANIANAASEKELAASKAETAGVATQVATTQNVETGTQVIDIATNKAQIASEKELAAAKALSNGGAAAGTGGAAGGGAAEGGAAAAGGAASVVPAAISILVAIAAVTAAIIYAVKWYNKEKDAAEAAAKQAEEQSKIAKELQTNYENLNTAVGQYKKLQEELNELTYGTEEYNDKLKETNAEVMALIKKYPELASKMKVVNGLYTIAEEDLQEAVDKAESRANIGQAIAYSSDTAALEAQNVSLQKETMRDNLWTSADTANTVLHGVGTGLATGTAAGVAVGKYVFGLPAVGPIAAAIITASAAVTGAMVGVVGAVHVAKSIEEDYEAATDAFTKAYEKDKSILNDKETLKIALQAEGFDSKDLDTIAERILENSNAMRELGDTVATNNALIKAQNDAAAKEYISSLNNSAYENTKYQAQVDRLLAEEKEVYEKRAQEQWDNIKDKDVHKAYAELMGYTYIKNKTGKGRFSKKLEDGTWEEFDIDDETIRQALATKTAFEAADDKLNDFISQMEAFTGVIAKANKNLKGNFENIEYQLANLAVGLDVSFTDFSIKELELFNNYALVNLADKYTQNIQNAMLAQQEAINNIKFSNNESEADRKAAFDKYWSTDLVKELDKAEKETLFKFYEKSIGSSRVAFDRFFNSLGQNAGKAASFINDIDWTSNDAKEQYIELLEKEGIYTASVAEHIPSFVEELKLITSLEDLTPQKLAETNKLINSIIKDLSEAGDTIEEDDFKSLSESLKEFFVQTNEGVYMLTSSAIDFKNAAKESQRAQREALLEATIQEFLDVENARSRLSNTTINKNQKSNLEAVNEYEFSKNVFGKGTAIGGGQGVRWEETDIADGTLDRFLFFNNQESEQKAQALLYEYLLTDDEYAKEILQDIISGYNLQNYKDPATALRVLTQEQWNDITEQYGGDTLLIDFESQASGDRWEIDYDYMLEAVQKKQAENAVLLEEWQEYDQSAIQDWLAELREYGLINDNQFTNITSYKVGENDIVSQIQQAIAESAGQDNSKIKALAETMLKDAQSEEELTTIQELLETTYGITNILSNTEWQQMLDEAASLVKITQSQQLIENFTSSLELYEARLDSISNKLSTLEAQQKILYGEQVLNNLQQQNKLLADQAEILRLKQQLNTAERSRQLTFTNDTTKRTDIQAALQNLYSLITNDQDNNTADLNTIISSFGLSSLTSMSDYNTLMQTLLSNILTIEDSSLKNQALDYLTVLENTLGPLFSGEIEESIQKTFLTALEKNLEKFELEIQIKIDENEFKQSILDFKTEMGRVISDTASFDLVKDDIATYMQALNDLDQMTKVESLDGLTEADIAAGNLISKADYEAKKREIINSLMEKGISLKEAVIAMDEKANEKYEKYINLIDSANSALEHQKNLYELIYGDQAFTKMNSYYSQQVANAESVAAARLTQYQQDQEFMANAGTELSEYAQEQYLESAENYFQALNDLAALYQEKYINELKTALDNFDKEISGGLGTQALRDEWDWVAAVAEDSLGTLDTLFGIQSLESSFAKAIDAAPSISAQKTLNKLRDEELAKLRAKEKLTQADLDRAQKSLEITQAEIALQEAQMNKSKMRLTRGPDGTYSYQYVADQDAIAEKTDELNKLKQELVDIDENAAKDAADKVYEVYSEMIAKIEELGPDATEEEIYAVMQQYSTRINSLSGIATDALGKLRLSAQSVADAFGIEGSLEEIIPWTNTGWIDTVTSFASNGFENMFSSTWDTIRASLEDYRTKMYGEEGEEGLYSQLEAATAAYLESLNGDEGLIKAQEAELAAVTTLTTAMGDLSSYIESIIQVVDPAYVIPEPTGLATGGYTGEWDSSGRLAVLHQKELVLNATDTQKILDAVSLVRSFENSINSALSDRYMEQLALMNARLDLNNLDTQETNIEQTVHITAEFPNVSVKEEIEAAFEDIIDLAAQYAMENKK